mgnify:CR=1 FL=1|jgi:hypothetical protein
MARINIKTNGVFIDIVGEKNEPNKYDKFTVTAGTSKLCGNYAKRYKELIDKFKNEIRELADNEVLQMQLRIRENFLQDITLYTVRDTYIYARCPFFKNDGEVNEVRKSIDSVEFHLSDDGTFNIETLYDNQSFMNRVKVKLEKEMDKIISENRKNYRELYSN